MVDDTMAQDGATVRDDPMDALRRHIEAIPLVDHHVHCCLKDTPDEARFERLICESGGPLGDGQTRLDSQAGFALVRHCSPLLMGRRCGIRDYLPKRLAMDEAEVDRTMLRAAGVGRWIIDPGWGAGELVDMDRFVELSQGRVSRLVRLESVAEHVLAQGADGRTFPDMFRHELASQADGAVGFKTICAYRCGFDIDWKRPDDERVGRAVDAMDAAGRMRLTDPVVASFIVPEAMAYGLPIPSHVGLGDRDVDLRHSNPLELRDLLVEMEDKGVPAVLLHCWPFERESSYLCQNFTNVYMDVGLAMYLTGAQAVDPLERAMGLCPFPRLLYSSDAWGLPELHYLGARVFRDALRALLSRWVTSGDWTFDDACRVADMIGHGNAERLYAVPTVQ